DFDAELAAGAVFNCNLDRVELIRKLAPLCRHRFETFRRVCEIALLDNLRANRRMRTDQNALAALDAEIGLPNRNFLCDVALLPLCGAHGICAVDGESTDRQHVAAPGDDLRGDLLYE